MKNRILASLVLHIAFLAATARADEKPYPLEAADEEADGAVFAAGYYEKPGGPPETKGAKWIPGGERNLCSASTFSSLSGSETEDGQGRGDNDSAGGDDDGGSKDGLLATMDDCLALHDWASSHHGHWVVPQRNLRMTPLLVRGSCAVTVSVRREWRDRLPWGVAVSSEDVVRVARGLPEGFVDGGRVGGRGGMGCLGWERWEAVAVPVEWRVGGWVDG